jgi:hypothetical protein
MARFPSRWSGFPAAAFFWALLRTALKHRANRIFACFREVRQSCRVKEPAETR